MTRALDTEQLRRCATSASPCSPAPRAPPRACSRTPWKGPSRDHRTCRALPARSNRMPRPPPCGSSSSTPASSDPSSTPAAGRPHRAEGHRPAARRRHGRGRERDRARPARGRDRPGHRLGLPGRARAGGDRAPRRRRRHHRQHARSTRRGSAACSSRSSTCSTTTCSSPSRSSSPRPRGTARHAMVVDEQLRPLFAFLRAIPVPTSLFAAPEDWGSPSLGERIERAATELALLVRSGVGSVDRRPRVGRLPAPVRGQRHPRRAGRGRRRLRHRPHAARRRRGPLKAAGPQLVQTVRSTLVARRSSIAV